MIVVAILPIAIVAIVGARLYAASHSAERYSGFTSRFENVYMR